MALSTISRRHSFTPCWLVVPIYIPGRFRTGSSPSRTTIASAPYLFCLSFAIDIIVANLRLKNELGILFQFHLCSCSFELFLCLFCRFFFDVFENLLGRRFHYFLRFHES